MRNLGSWGTKRKGLGLRRGIHCAWPAALARKSTLAIEGEREKKEFSAHLRVCFLSKLSPTLEFSQPDVFPYFEPGNPNLLAPGEKDLPLSLSFSFPLDFCILSAFFYNGNESCGNGLTFNLFPFSSQAIAEMMLKAVRNLPKSPSPLAVLCQCFIADTRAVLKTSILCFILKIKRFN